MVLAWLLVDCPEARTWENDGGGIKMAGGGTSERLNHSETVARECADCPWISVIYFCAMYNRWFYYLVEHSLAWNSMWLQVWTELGWVEEREVGSRVENSAKAPWDRSRPLSLRKLLRWALLNSNQKCNCFTLFVLNPRAGASCNLWISNRNLLAKNIFSIHAKARSETETSWIKQLK